MKTSLLVILALGFCSTVTSSKPDKRGTCASIYRREAQKISCSALSTGLPIGPSYYPYALYFYVMMSPFYAATMADALGYSSCCCGGNSTILKNFDLISAWSGMHGPISIDTAFGFERNIIRLCEYPTAEVPKFICSGTPGTPGTRGESLGTIEYTVLLQDDINHEWTLFGDCHSPENPIGTSFIVISTSKTLPTADRANIIAKLNELGFRTDNILEPDFTRVSSGPQC